MIRSGFALTCLSTVVWAQAPTQWKLQERKDVSAFMYQDLQGVGHQLSEHKGKLIVLGFLATWSKPSRPSARELHWLQKQETALGITVLPLVDNSQENSAVRRPDTAGGLPGLDVLAAQAVGDAQKQDPAESFKMPVDFRAFIEAKGFEKKTRAIFPPFNDIPTFMIIDREGRLAWMSSGYKKGEVTRALQALLSEP